MTQDGKCKWKVWKAKAQNEVSAATGTRFRRTEPTESRPALQWEHELEGLEARKRSQRCNRST
eukprot:1685811-Pyramimonas_sp.AAC.1